MSIEQALLHIKASEGKPFTLVFVRASGKKQGSVKIAKCTYGTPPVKTGRGRSGPPSHHQPATPGENKRWKENGQIPLIEVESGRLITPLISHIIGLNNFKIKH